MKSTKLILTLSVIIVIASLLLLLTTLNKFGITGFATDTAGANITIETFASVAFTDDSCDWGTGHVVDSPEVPFVWAIVNSNGSADVNASGWAGCDGLAVVNDGNINVSLDVDSSKVASAFIGGTTPGFKIMATSTCTGTPGLAAPTEVTGAAQSVCSNWAMNAPATFDFTLTIPEDAIGVKTTVITATATA